MSETWSFAPGHVPSWPALLLLGLCAAIALVEATLSFTRRGRAMPRRTAIAVLLLRLLAVLALFAIAFELTLRFDRVAPTSRRVVVLVDRSASIGVPDAPEGGINLGADTR